MPDPWRNRKIVRVVAAIDMAFPVIIVIFYIFRLLTDPKHDEELPRGPLEPGEKPVLTVFMWIGAFLINIIQFMLAYQLFFTVKEGRQESQSSIRKANWWLRVSNFILVLLLAELFYFLFFGKGDGTGRKMLATIICVAEIAFKAVAMYFVKEFIDDLKSAFIAPAPRVQFISFLMGSKKKASNQDQGQTGSSNA